MDMNHISQAWPWGVAMYTNLHYHHHYEREHLFEKPLTPSDVGKLNRLVIPKQHAERYFPLGGDSGEKGLILSFEDEAGKPWRFRYSYWTSSQSYVLTKGWSRYVKEKRLDARDVVHFERMRGLGIGDRLFIGFRRRGESETPAAAVAPLPAVPVVAAAHSAGGEQQPWSPMCYSYSTSGSYPNSPATSYAYRHSMDHDHHSHSNNTPHAAGKRLKARNRKVSTVVKSHTSHTFYDECLRRRIECSFGTIKSATAVRREPRLSEGRRGKKFHSIRVLYNIEVLYLSRDIVHILNQVIQITV
jgi:hypothetical protein